MATLRVLLVTALAALVGGTMPAAAKDTGLIFVSSEKSHHVLVLEPKTFKVVKEIKTAPRPRDMHVSADHRLL
jgi:hypothetical protein